MKKKRQHFFEIDILKAFAAILVIVIHVTERYQGNSALRHTIWDLSHFSVGLFVFASGFLHGNSSAKVSDIKSGINILITRGWRIIIPYFIYAVSAFTIFALTHSTDKILKTVTLEYVVDTIILHGGVGYNWITRIFILLTVTIIILDIIKPKIKHIYTFTCIIFAVVTFYLTFYTYRHLKYFYYLPGWFLIYHSGYLLFQYYKKRRKFLAKMILLYLPAFVGCFILLKTSRKTTSIFLHKYPPDLYFISYNAILAAIVSIFAIRSCKVVERIDIIKKSISFLSRNSYEIFFLQLLVIQIMGNLKTNVWLEFMIITGSTIAGLKIRDWISSKIRVK